MGFNFNVLQLYEDKQRNTLIFRILNGDDSYLEALQEVEIVSHQNIPNKIGYDAVVIVRLKTQEDYKKVLTLIKK